MLHLLNESGDDSTINVVLCYYYYYKLMQIV